MYKQYFCQDCCLFMHGNVHPLCNRFRWYLGYTYFIIYHCHAGGKYSKTLLCIYTYCYKTHISNTHPHNTMSLHAKLYCLFCLVAMRELPHLILLAIKTTCQVSYTKDHWPAMILNLLVDVGFYWFLL